MSEFELIAKAKKQNLKKTTHLIAENSENK